MSLEGFDYCQNSEFIAFPSKKIIACILYPTKEILNGVIPATSSRANTSKYLTSVRDCKSQVLICEILYTSIPQKN